MVRKLKDAGDPLYTLCQILLPSKLAQEEIAKFQDSAAPLQSKQVREKRRYASYSRWVSICFLPTFQRLFLVMQDFSTSLAQPVLGGKAVLLQNWLLLLQGFLQSWLKSRRVFRETSLNPTAQKFSGTVIKLFYSLIESEMNFPHIKEMFKLLPFR